MIYNDYNNYLSHYGVVGMKWGVRHNTQKAYDKAVKKRNKMTEKALMYRAKSDKLKNVQDVSASKYVKYRTKMGKYDLARYNRLTERGRKKAEAKYHKYEQKVNAAEYKGVQNLNKQLKNEKKVDKFLKKRDKWDKKVSSAFSEVDADTMRQIKKVGEDINDTPISKFDYTWIKEMQTQRR